MTLTGKKSMARTGSTMTTMVTESTRLVHMIGKEDIKRQCTILNDHSTGVKAGTARIKNISTSDGRRRAGRSLAAGVGVVKVNGDRKC